MAGGLRLQHLGIDPAKEDAMRFFNNPENLNWNRLWWVIGIITTLWLGMATIIPIEYFKPVSVVLSAVQSALLFATRGTKYVVNRQEPPPDGKP